MVLDGTSRTLFGAELGTLSENGTHRKNPRMRYFLLHPGIGFLSNYFIIGFRIVLPIFVAILILNCALGIMTKIAPQIHMFSIGVQIKVIGGLIIIFLIAPLLPTVAGFIFRVMQEMVILVMKGMQ